MIRGENFDLYKGMKETENKNYLGKQINFFSYYFNMFKRVWAIRQNKVNLLLDLCRSKIYDTINTKARRREMKYTVVL